MQSIFALAITFLAVAYSAPTTEEKRQAGFVGEMTHYTPSVGSCGQTNTEADAVVALPIDKMNNPVNPNLNPLCGQFITITHNGASHKAKIVDTCGGCATNDIDLSPTLFKLVAPNGDGRVPGVSWSFDTPQ